MSYFISRYVFETKYWLVWGITQEVLIRSWQNSIFDKLKSISSTTKKFKEFVRKSAELFTFIFQGIYSSVIEDASGPEEMVDGGPDIFPHSHNFHVPFFITSIRKGERDEKQQPFNPDT